MTTETILPVLAGQRPDGQLIYEELAVSALETRDHYLVLRSPSFCQGTAKGDVIERLPGGRFEVVKRSGNLAIRVIAKENLSRIADQLVAVFERYQGTLDVQSERMLVLSVPVAAGFEAIESAMSDVLGSYENNHWVYGNVYDVQDGSPLNWWQEFLQAESQSEEKKEHKKPE
jgi:hypothetical protein